MSGPPFRSVDRALSWAFQVVACDIGDISSIYRRRDTDPPHESEWSPFEKHGQAAAIVGFAHRVLEDRELVYVYARFGREPSCENRVLQWAAASLGTGVHSRRALRTVWMMHCGAKIGRASLAKEMGLGTNWRPAMAFKSRFYEHMGDLATKVYIKLEPILLEKGIVVTYSQEAS